MSAADNAAVTPAGENRLRYASGPGRWVLLVTVLGSAMTSIDATVVDIALPAIGRDFGASLTVLQWVVTAYTLALAGLLLFAGTLGDRYGRKRIFLIGAVWFALSSLLCGLAAGSAFLIAARAVQGVGAALLTPGSLAIIEASVRPADRGKAIGAWSGLSGVAAAIIAACVRHVPESRDPEMAGRVDITGGILVTLGLIGVTYGLIDGPRRRLA